MIVIVGLGNPDNKYTNTYHNMGYMAVDYFAKENGIQFTKNKFHAMYGEAVLGGEKVAVIKPTTYMNNSGISVSEIVNKLKLPLSNIIIVYDDIDIPCGTLRYRKSGSAGTHNGMRNIVECLGSQNFARLRVGIGKDDRMALVDYVLSRVSNENMDKITGAMPKINKALLRFIESKGNIENIDFNSF